VILPSRVDLGFMVVCAALTVAGAWLWPVSVRFPYTFQQIYTADLALAILVIVPYMWVKIALKDL
jgi:hypothetical protein